MATIYSVDLQETSESIINYCALLEDAYSDASNSMTLLINNPSFQGRAAAAVKCYFSEVHMNLFASFVILANHLCNLFHVYSARYTGNPVNETAAETGEAILPTSEMDSMSSQIDSLKAGHLVSIGDSLSKAASCVSNAGVSITTPTTNSAESSLNTIVNDLIKLIEAIHESEAQGEAEFSDDSDFSVAKNALDKAISTCSKPGYMISYTPGAISSITDFSDLSNALANMNEYASENQELIIQAQTVLASQKQTRLEIIYEEEAAKKAFWSTLATIAVTAAAIIGTVALVTTTGPIGIAFALKTASVLITAYNAGTRIGNLIDQASGNSASDVVEIDSGDLSKAKIVADYYEKSMAGDQDLADAEILNYVSSKVVGELASDYASQFSDNENLTDMVGSVASKGTSFAISSTVSGSVSFTGVGTLVTGVVTVVSDCFTAEADEALEECLTEMQNLNETMSHIGQSTIEIECDWANTEQAISSTEVST